jgi:proteasome assembly chaperone (PAC2) family protein
VSDSADVVYLEAPETIQLRAPRVVVALAGWPDAAQVATRAALFLQDGLEAVRFAELRADDFHDYTASRPTVAIEDGHVKGLSYPKGDFYYWRNPAPDGGDLIIFVGTEPQLHWRRYVAALLDVFVAQGAVALYALGGLYDDVPHTRPPRLSSTCDGAALRARLAARGVVFSDYEGPASLHTALVAECRARRLPAASLWGHAPGYAHLTWNPLVTVALLDLLGQLLNLPLDLDEVRSAADYLKRALDQLATSDPRIGAMLAKLEASYDSDETRSATEAPLGGSPSAELSVSDRVLREIEEILRQNGEADSGEGEPKSP